MLISPLAQYFLRTGVSYDVAYSLCGQAGLLLFRFSENFSTVRPQGLILAISSPSYNFLIGRTKVSVSVPEYFQTDGMVWTKPVKDEHPELELPVLAISIIWAWENPVEAASGKMADLSANREYAAYGDMAKDTVG
jgi:hypothetical protein